MKTHKDNTILGLIPARGGSKGLPGKNIRPLSGKPLIAWTIEQALTSNNIDRVIVSTDSRDIADVARVHGVDTPFLRPDELATDKAEMIDVILHVLESLKEDGFSYDSVMLLQPTSPLRTALDIDSVIELLNKKGAKAVVSVCEAEHHPYWSNTLPPDGCMKDFLARDARKNRQELPIVYRLNGAIFFAHTDYLKAHGEFIGDETYAYIMPRERSVDIDSELDFRFAELLMKHPGLL